VSPKSYQLQTASAEETEAWGERLAAVLPGGAVLALCGDLGAGKTTLVRGLCKGFGVTHLEEVASPTFTLLNEYPGPRPVAHFDFYRLDSINSVPDLGFDEALHSGAGVLVEWAEKFPGALPADRTLTIRLLPSGESPNARQIDVALPAAPQDEVSWRAVREFLEKDQGG